MNRKARSDSRLKTLAPERQKQVVEWSRDLSLPQLAERVRKELGVVTSRSALSEFLSWYHLSRHLEEAATFADDLKRTLATLPQLNLQEEQINAAAQVVFELEATRQKDVRAFTALRGLRQRDKVIANDSRRIAVLEKRAALADQAELAVKDPSLTPEERMSRMRQIFGMPA